MKHSTIDYWIDKGHLTYYEAELEYIARPGAESANECLDLIGEIGDMAIEVSRSTYEMPGVELTDGWHDAELGESKRLFSHAETGWMMLLSQIGHFGVNGFRREYFNPRYKNTGYSKLKSFGGSMGRAIAYQQTVLPVLLFG